jgi:hypothetical protein
MEYNMIFENMNLKIHTVLEIIIVPIIAYGVYLLNDMNKNIQTLNTQVAVILAERDVTRDVLKDHETRIRFLEGRK